MWLPTLSLPFAQRQGEIEDLGTMISLTFPSPSILPTLINHVIIINNKNLRKQNQQNPTTGEVVSHFHLVSFTVYNDEHLLAYVSLFMYARSPSSVKIQSILGCNRTTSYYIFVIQNYIYYTNCSSLLPFRSFFPLLDMRICGWICKQAGANPRQRLYQESIAAVQSRWKLESTKKLLISPHLVNE